MSPRDKGKKTTGAYIDATPRGYLRLCFRWPRGARGKLYRVTTEYRDTELNRRELERVRDLVGAEIRAGVFKPERRFPSLFTPKIVLSPASKRRELAADLRAWIEERAERKVRVSRVRDYRSHLANYIEPSEIARFDPAELSIEALSAFQTWLVSRAGKEKKGVSEKTAQNVIRGTLKAYLRDRGFAVDVVEGLRWERYAPTREQDPFEAGERDKLVAWFKAKRPRAEYVSLRLRFLGISPSEVRGLNVGDFSRATKTVSIRRSRHLGSEGATKTRARERVVDLGDVAAEVAELCGVRAPAEPMIDVAEDTLRDNFTRAQKALGLTHRSLYQAKHTYATLALLDGESPAIVARNLGISLATLEKHYAAALQRGRIGATGTGSREPQKLHVRRSKTPRGS